MTKEQAKKYLSALNGLCGCAENGETMSIAMAEIREAIEKQVPMPMELDYDGFYCGRCNAYLSEFKKNKYIGYDYCPQCGQEIDYEN